MIYFIYNTIINKEDIMSISLESAKTLYYYINNNQKAVKNLKQEERKILVTALQKIKDNKLDGQSDEKTLKLTRKIGNYKPRLFNEKHENSNFIVSFFKGLLNRLNLRTSSNEVLLNLVDVKMSHLSNQGKLENLNKEIDSLEKEHKNLKNEIERGKNELRYTSICSTFLDALYNKTDSMRLSFAKEKTKSKLQRIKEMEERTDKKITKHILRPYRKSLENLLKKRNRDSFFETAQSLKNEWSEKYQNAENTYTNIKALKEATRSEIRKLKYERVDLQAKIDNII